MTVRPMQLLFQVFDAPQQQLHSRGIADGGMVSESPKLMELQAWHSLLLHFQQGLQ